MRRHWDIFKKSTHRFPVKHLVENLDPRDNGGFRRSFKKIYFLIWGLFILSDFLWAVADLLHFYPLPIFSSSPVIITKQDLTDVGKIAGVSKEKTDPTINKSEISVAILNGSGKAGQAADFKKKLEELGFKVASVGTAKTLAPTMIIYHHDSPDKAKVVADALLDYQPSIQISPDIETDILIIIGKK